MIRRTVGVNIQLCPKTERTNGDVSWDPQREVFFEWFLRLFIEHEFIDADVRGVSETKGSRNNR